MRGVPLTLIREYKNGSIGVTPPFPAQETSPFAVGLDALDKVQTPVAQDVPLDFSTHAWARMQEREITTDQVMDAIKNGSRVTQPNGNIRCTGAVCVVVIDTSGRIVTIY